MTAIEWVTAVRERRVAVGSPDGAIALAVLDLLRFYLKDELRGPWDDRSSNEGLCTIHYVPWRASGVGCVQHTRREWVYLVGQMCLISHLSDPIENHEATAP